MRLNDAQKTSLETDYIVIQSESFEDTLYAVKKDGTGIIVNTHQGELPIETENFEEFINELLSIWELHKIERRKSGA